MTTLQSLIDAELPFAGPCLICGGPDKRHRVLDAVADMVRNTEDVETLTADYGLSEELVKRLGEEWR